VHGARPLRPHYRCPYGSCTLGGSSALLMPGVSMPMCRFSDTYKTGLLMCMSGMRGMTLILTHFPLLVRAARFPP
jgi:hypothetical protein